METKQFSEIDNKIRGELMEYATEKYGRTFEEVFYETAVDATHSYTRCLKDSRGRIFNVYQGGESGRRTDDYENCIVDYKVKEYLSELIGEDMGSGSIGVMAVMNITEEIDALENMSAEECIRRFGLYSLIFVYHMEGERGTIAENRNAVLEIYKKLSTLDTSTIDFNVVVTSGDPSRVAGVLENMRLKYSGSWYSYETVAEYISRVNPGLTPVYDVESMVEE